MFNFNFPFATSFFFELQHSGFSPLCPWHILVRGCFCWALPRLLCFSAGWRNAYLAGASVFRPLWCFCLWLFCVVDLPYYMTTGVNVDVILNCFFVKTRERRGSSFSQLGLEPNHTGLTAQSLFFLESCRVKRSDTQTFSNFSNYFKRVLKLQKRSSSFSK